jgi:hypothetical protein
MGCINVLFYWVANPEYVLAAGPTTATMAAILRHNKIKAICFDLIL